VTTTAWVVIAGVLVVAAVAFAAVKLIKAVLLALRHQRSS
jgi:hypothetical protein